MSTPENKPRMARGTVARAAARKLALQALYGWQLNHCEWQDLMQEFDRTNEGVKADRDYFQLLVTGICTDIAALDELLAQWTDRPSNELDPIEHAALLIGIQELRAHPELPYKVAISEATNLTSRFGATDGHKFVNAVMDRAAKALRPLEA